MDGQTGEPPGGLRGLGRGGRGEEEDGLGAVPGTDAAEPAQDLGDVGAEDAAVGVAFVDDDVAQRAQEGGPAGVGGEYPAVQHVRVGEYVVGVLTYPFAFLDGGVAVVHGGPHAVAERCGERLHGTALVGGERLRRGEVQGGRAPAVGCLRAVQECGEHRRQVGEGLAGRGAGGDHDGFAVQGVLGGGGLVGPRVVDPGQLNGVDHFWPDAIGPDRMPARTRGQVLHMSDARSPARPCGEPVQDPTGGGAGVPALGRPARTVIRGHRHRVCHWRGGQWS